MESTSVPEKCMQYRHLVEILLEPVPSMQDRHVRRVSVVQRRVKLKSMHLRRTHPFIYRTDPENQYFRMIGDQ